MENPMSPEDQSQQKTLPKEAIEWMIAFLNAKKDPNCAGENRSLSSKPYSGIPTYVNNRIEISRKLDLFTVMELKMLLKELEIRGKKSTRTLGKRVNKAKLILKLKTFFFIDKECEQPISKADPIWKLLEESRRNFFNSNDFVSDSVPLHTNAMMPSTAIAASSPAPDQTGILPSPFQQTEVFPLNNFNHQHPPASYYQPTFPHSFPITYPTNAFITHISPNVHSNLPSQINNNQQTAVGSKRSLKRKKANRATSEQKRKTSLSTDNNTSSKSINGTHLQNGNSIKHTYAQTKRNVKIKEEPIDYDSHPRNPQEQAMLMELRIMGFTSRIEALGGIRYAIANSPPGLASPDAAMLWIVSQREAAEEAKYLDLARIQSERTREAEATIEKFSVESMLVHAPADFILLGTDPYGKEAKEKTVMNNEFYPTSIVLKSDKFRRLLRTVCSNGKKGKELVVQYLSLEKKALKWYGIASAYSYFQYNSLVKLSPMDKKEAEIDGATNDLDKMLKILADENKSLEKALYSLSEQTMNIPKIFLNAKKDALAKGLPTDALNKKSTNCGTNGKAQDQIDVDSDEVIVIEMSDDIDVGDFVKKDIQAKPKHEIVDLT